MTQVLDVSQRLAGGGGFIDEALGGFVGGLATFAESLNPLHLVENAREEFSLKEAHGVALDQVRVLTTERDSLTLRVKMLESNVEDMRVDAEGAGAEASGVVSELQRTLEEMTKEAAQAAAHCSKLEARCLALQCDLGAVSHLQNFSIVRIYRTK